VLHVLSFTHSSRSLVIDSLLNAKVSGNYAVAYYYFDYREQTQPHPALIMFNILRQIVTQLHTFPQSLRNLHAQLKEQDPRGLMREVSHVFFDIVAEVGHCFIILDALDECNGKSNRKEILHFLSSCKPETIHVFITARPHLQEIEQHFSDSVKVQVSADDHDLKEFCRRSINDNEYIRELVDKALERVIVETIADNAQGM